MARAFSDQLPDWNLGTRTHLSKMKGTDLRYNLTMSPGTQFEMKVSRRSCLRGMFVVDADSAIDHLTAEDAEQNDDCTTERRQDLGYEPGISMGAPAFRYCMQRAVNDRLGESVQNQSNLDSYKFQRGRRRGQLGRQESTPVYRKDRLLPFAPGL